MPNGWAGTSATNSIIATTNGSGGILTLSVTSLYCGTSATDTLNIASTVVNYAITVSNNTLTAIQNNASYQWIDCDAKLPMVGATNQSFTATANGRYAVVVSNNMCSDTSACTIINSFPFGLKGKKSTHSISIHPNPTRDIVTIESSVEKLLTLQLLDVQGRVLQHKIVNANSTQLDISDKEAGVYFITVVSSLGNEVFKVVKE